MLDLFYLAIGVAGFCALWAITKACDRVLGGRLMFDYIVSGTVAVFLLVYLGWAMFRPEKF